MIYIKSENDIILCRLRIRHRPRPPLLSALPLENDEHSSVPHQNLGERILEISSNF